MGRIPDETIQALRDRVDIVDVVGRYVTLKQAGRNFKGLCPFHSEKTPSFNVQRERQIFHCFGCGAGGNAISFLMQHEGLTFPEAARQLAREVGIEIPESDTGERGQVERIAAANECAQRLYQRALAAPEGARARAYLEQRGLDAAQIARFGIGFAPDRWDAVLRALAAEKISAEIGERAGLLAARQSGGHYDRLRGRVTFPIQDVRGRVIGFGGRALASDQEPKYLNTPESPLFHKREAFYGFPFALEPIRRQGRAVVVEGYFDLIALRCAGIDEGLATCGTALTSDHAKQLRRRTRDVVLLFDGDTAGRHAIAASLEVLLPEGLRPRAAVLPSGDDPDTFLAREGAEALRRLVDGAPSAIDVVVETAMARGCTSAWEKADVVSAVAPLLALVPEAVERAEHARRLALALGTETRHVETAVRKAARGESADVSAALPEPAPRLVGPEERHARGLVKLLLAHPSLGARLDRAELASLLPAGPAATLLDHLLGAGAASARTEVGALAEGLAPEPQRLLFSLAVEEETLDEAEASRALDETLATLRERRRAAERRELTQQLVDPRNDALALLAAKQRQLEERRANLGISPGPQVGRR